MDQKNGEEFAALVGIDWADENHEVRLQVVETGKIEEGKLKQEPDALIEWVGSLRKRFPGRKVAVAMEQRKGALIYALMCHDFLVLYPINPKSLSAFREALHPSGVKSDPVDADLALEMLRFHRNRLRAWIPDTAETRLLQMLVEERRNLVDEGTQLTNRLTSTLKEYFPQALKFAGELKSQQAIDFLTKWPTLKGLQKSKPETIEKFYVNHGFRNRVRLKERLKAIQDAKELTTDHAVVTAGTMKAKAIVQQLQPLKESIREYDLKIKELFDSHPDRDLFSSFPGAKEVFGPRLLAAFGRNRDRYQSAEEMQTFSGIAPVTVQSGKSRVVSKRWACPNFLKQTFQEYSGHSVKKPGWASRLYQKLRARGVKHHAALRVIAFKWIRIMFRCWQDQEPYSEEKYNQALKRRSSHLAMA